MHLALSPATVFVCENPSILSAAASSLADRCQPLVCIEGQPSHAAANLLGRLGRAGVALRYHGDFDRSGLQIAAQMIARFAAIPWRMSSADYVAELDHASLAFDAEVPPTSWDRSLEAAIRTHQKVVLEESCLYKVVRAGDRVKLDAVFIGNAAAALHGVPIATQDIALFVRDTSCNAAKIDRLVAVLLLEQFQRVRDALDDGP